jgi:hypothetical protein
MATDEHELGAWSESRSQTSNEMSSQGSKNSAAWDGVSKGKRQKLLLPFGEVTAGGFSLRGGGGVADGDGDGEDAR